MRTLWGHRWTTLWGATRVRGVPNGLRDGCEPSFSLGPSVELPVRHGPRQGCADMGGAARCGPCLWGRRWSSLWGTIRVRGSRHMQGDAMRILPLGPYVEFFMGHDLCAGRAELAGGTPCELCLWHRRWSSPGGTTCVRDVPKSARGRSAIPPHFFPFFSSVPSLFTYLWQNLILPFFPPVSSLLPLPSSLGVSPSSLQFVCERDRWHLRPPARLPRISAGAPRPWFTEFPGSSGSIPCIVYRVLYSMAFLCVALAWALLCASRRTGSQCSTLP